MKTQKRLVKTLALASVAVCLAGSARAQLLSNTNSYADTFFNVGYYTVAQQFTTGSQAEALASLTLFAYNSYGTPDFTVGIYGDSGGVPGSLISVLSGPTAPTYGSTDTYDASGVTLAANTSYWVVLGNAAGSSGNLEIVGTDSPAPASQAGWVFGANAYAYSPGGIDIADLQPDNIGIVPIMDLEGPAPVPEPSALALAALGGLGFLAVRRKK